MTSTTEEVSRHRCEVRQVLAWRVEDRGKAMDYLSRVKGDRREKLENLGQSRKLWTG